MARIRSIHPGILTDEAFMTLTAEQPLAIALMLGLWVEADDSGTFEWKPISIKARCLPAADASIPDLMDVLARVGMIKRFEFDGKAYGVVRNFVKFQRPKDPNDHHPYSEESRLYAGFTSEGERPNATTGRKSFGTSSEPLPNSHGTTSEKSAQRKEEGGRRDKEEINNKPRKARPLEILQECLSEATARDVVEHRRKKRSPLTDRAAQELVREMVAFGDPERAAAEMISRGWTGFKSEWMANQARAGPQQNRSSAFQTSKPAANF